MKRAPYVILLLALALVSAPAHPQRDYGPEFKSISTWPENDVVPTESDGKYVFLSRDGVEMILAYPADLDLGPEQKGGELRVERFHRNNQVDASLVVDVERSGSYYTYKYGVSNSADARQAIRTVRVVAAGFGDGDSISGPSLWGAANAPSRVNAVHHAIGSSDGVFLAWYVNDPRTNVDRDASAILPGSELDGFRVTSRLRPGMTLAYVQGGDAPGLRKDMPRAVLEQTVPLMQIEFNSQNLVTVGPKFDADATQHVIFADFHSGITRMADAGLLDLNSPAVGRALAVLQGVSPDPKDRQRGFRSAMRSQRRLQCGSQAWCRSEDSKRDET